jgi:hypothetical protein
MTATCPYCDTQFHNVDRSEDGAPEVPEARRCAQPGCEVELCKAGCEELSFECEGCSKRFCQEHDVRIYGMPHCLPCALDAVYSEEPPCHCQQVDVDRDDATYCDLHYSQSDWNRRLRAVTAAQEYERFNTKEIA